MKFNKRWLLLLVPIAAIALMADSCDGSPSDNANTSATVQQGTVRYEADVTEKNQETLDKNQPIPTITQSNERANLIERLNRFNDPNKVSYIYLIDYGKVMAFYTIKGKVSSVDSYLTTSTQLVDDNGQPCNASNGDVGNGNGAENGCYPVESPDLDGSYGSNGNAIFFFTTSNVYVEWQGDYMLVDQPLQLSTPPELVQTVGK